MDPPPFSPEFMNKLLSEADPNDKSSIAGKSRPAFENLEKLTITLMQAFLDQSESKCLAVQALKMLFCQTCPLVKKTCRLI